MDDNPAEREIVRGQLVGTAVPDPGRMPDLVLPVPAGMAVAVPAAAGLAAADWAVVLVVALLAAAPPLLLPHSCCKIQFRLEQVLHNFYNS